MTDASGLKIFSFRVFMIAELVGNTVMICYSVLLVFLYFKKRDSFPMLYSVFLGVNLLFIIADTIAAYAFGFIAKFAWNDLTTDIVKRIIAAAIWIPYMFKSERVKLTFVNTYDTSEVHESGHDVQVIKDNSDIY